MTICIAGICGDESVVLASDRMLTEYGTLMVELEPETAKRLELTDNCVCLTAGSALRPADIDVKLRNEQFSRDVNDIADTMKERVNEVSKRVLEDEFLRPYGLQLDSFFESPVANMPVGANIFEQMEQQKQQGILGIRLLIAGVDANGGHIFVVGDPAEKLCFDSIRFHAIGSGTDHARGSLIFNEFHVRSPSEKEGAYLVYEAKKDAEIAPGVGGNNTDMWVVRENGSHKIGDGTLEEFEAIRRIKKDANQEAIAKAYQSLEEVSLRTSNQQSLSNDTKNETEEREEKDEEED